MKKLFLSLGLLLFVFGGVTAQKKYTYFKGQDSPFNGELYDSWFPFNVEFNEPRYKDVDSITYICYENKFFVDYLYAEGYLGETQDFIIDRADRLSETLDRPA